MWHPYSSGDHTSGRARVRVDVLSEQDRGDLGNLLLYVVPGSLGLAEVIDEIAFGAGIAHRAIISGLLGRSSAKRGRRPRQRVDSLVEIRDMTAEPVIAGI